MSRKEFKEALQTDIVTPGPRYQCPCCGEECSELFEGEFDNSCAACYYFCDCGREMEIAGRVACEKCEQYQ